MKFWSDLSKLSGTTLKTLGHGNAFDVVEINESHVVVRPHATRCDRSISRNDFQNVFDEICLRGSINLIGIRAFSEMHPVCVAAMIAELPYIASTNKPKICLRIAAIS